MTFDETLAGGDGAASGGDDSLSGDDMIAVHTCRFAHDAQRVVDLLLEAGLDAWSREMSAGMFPASDDAFTVFVPASEAARAKELIAETLSAPAPAGGGEDDNGG